MKKRTNPLTSLIANLEMEISGGKVTMKNKILASMQKNGSGNYEKIAKDAGLKDSQVWKRLSEMQTEGDIYQTVNTAVLSSGKQGIVWAVKTKAPEPIPQSDYSLQPKLF